MMRLAIELATLMMVFSVLESWWPSSPMHKWWRRPLLVDLCGWAVHPLALSSGIALAVACSDVLLVKVSAAEFWPGLAMARARVAGFSMPVQIAFAVIVADFLAYWIHRAYHRVPALWTFHIVHHSSEQLDWLSTSRLHPLSQAANTAAVGVILLLAGLPVAAVIAANVFIGAAALLAHANVPWTFGPLRRLLVSPLFHQWHHARTVDEHQPHELGNFGAIFSIWDWLFGTWKLPSLNRPERFGVPDAPPQTVSGLILHPLTVSHRTLVSKLKSLRSSRRMQFTPSEAADEVRE
jgi:sterol desaturase/sphingolipid hydroxylase (fatty acid hydroxylase superfamily)